jgi:uncharacterized protein
MIGTDPFVSLKNNFGTLHPIIGMIHLAPLPGSPRYNKMPMNQVVDLALANARVLSESGFHGAMIENFGDFMFLKKAPDETIAAISHVATLVVKEIGIPLGVCVLQADAMAAIAVASAVGARFIRAPYYTEAYISDSGYYESSAASVLRYRKFIEASVDIYADVHVKYAYPLMQRPIEDAATCAVERGLADAILVTGKATGAETDPEHVRRVKNAVSQVPVFVASGVTTENFSHYADAASGVVMGSSLKIGGIVTAPVDPEKARRFMDTVHQYWD